MIARSVFVVGAFLAAMLIMVPSPARAATIDEILAMNDAGLSAEVIIDVIDATGLDEPIDVDTLILLQKKGVDEQVIEYLAGMLPDDNQGGSENYEDQGAEESNRIGGEGFHSSNRNDGANERNYGNDYWQPSDSYYGYYPPLGSISIYEPPVYFIDNEPYYHGWRAPRVYPHHRGYWNDGGYGIYNNWGYPYGYWQPDGYYPPYGGDYWGSYNHGWGWNGGWYWDGRDFRKHSSLDAWYGDDDFSFRISF
jgi:hypothetical protein